MSILPAQLLRRRGVRCGGGRAAMPGGAPRVGGGESPVRAANGRRFAGPGGDLPADRRATRQAPASAGRLAANAARPVYRRQPAA